MVHCINTMEGKYGVHITHVVKLIVNDVTAPIIPLVITNAILCSEVNILFNFTSVSRDGVIL